MKLNDKEVAHFAVQQDGVVREGVLFKRGEKDKDPYKPKCFVLKGNLLFYFKGSSPTGVPGGCIVLERISVQNAGEVTPKKLPQLFCFKIEFECHGQRAYYIGCESPQDRDAWMTSIKTASFGFLKENIARLRRRLDDLEVSGSDSGSNRLASLLAGGKGKARSARPSMPPVNLAAGKYGSIWISMVSCEERKEDASGPSYLSMVLSIAGKTLPRAPNGAPPTTQMIIQERSSSRTPWSEVTRTEVIAQNANPQFSTNIRFEYPTSSAEKMVGSTEIRILVERVAQQSGQGQQVISLSHGLIDRSTAEARLSASGIPGNYLVRDRAKTVGANATLQSWAYSFFGMNGKCAHLRIDVSAQTGMVSFNGVLEQYLPPGSNLMSIIVYLNQKRQSQGLTVGQNIPAPAAPSMASASPGEATPIGWAGCSLGDVADEGELAFNIEPPQTMDDGNGPTSPGAFAGGSSGASGPAPKLKLSRRMNFKFNVPTTASGGMKLLLVEQLMGESPFYLSIPAQLLHLFVKADKTALSLFEGLTGLQGKLSEARHRVQDAIMQRVQTNLEHIAFIDSYKGAAFKSSVDKKSKPLEMFAMNLHVETLRVLAGRARKAGQGRTLTKGGDAEAQYHTFTHGGFVHHADGFKHGGLLKILQAPMNRASFEPLRRIRNVRQNVVIFGDEVHNMDSEICRVLAESNFTDREMRIQLGEQITELNEASAIFEAEVSKEVVGQAFLAASRVYHNSMASRATVEDVLQPIRTCAKQMMTSLQELRAVCSKGCPPEVHKAVVDALRAAVTKLKHACNGAVSETVECLLIHELQIEPPDDVEYEEVIHRRDMCFCQALTTVVTAVHTLLTDTMGDKTQLYEQIDHIGHLVNFQSLLSTHGHEMGMIEDMAQAVRDVGRAVVRLRGPDADDGRQPPHVEVTGQRYGVIVDLTVDAAVLSGVPDSFIEDGIKLVPVMFTQGINEMQMLARNLGDTLLQEQICEENFKVLQQYAKEYKSLAFEKNYDKSDISEIDRALAELDKAIRSRSFKHALEVLTTSADAVRLLKGSRFISCKSGKDRTGMSVTLEECRILAARHEMDPKFVQHALDVTRSKGVRIMNVEKNIGEPRYAFNKLQLMALPKLLRPPIISIGSSTT